MSIQQYFPNALDELQSQMTPEQFSYLLSVLSSADQYTEFASVTTSIDDSIQFPESTRSDGKRSRTISTENTKTIVNTLGGNRKNASLHTKNAQDIARLEYIENSRAIFSRNELNIPLSQLRKRPDVLQSSFDSALSTTKNEGENSSVSRDGVTSKDSVLALQGISFTMEENVIEDLHLTQRKYDETPLPLIVFQGTYFHEESSRTCNTNISNDASLKSCSQLPVCKRIMGKYFVQNGRESRSSSVESVKAETLPDLDNPLLKIAGKIANEPVNPFPILKNSFFKKPSQVVPRTNKKFTSGGAKSFSSLDVQRIEKDIERELTRFQSYENVSDFFSQRTLTHKACQNKPAKGASRAGAGIRHNLSRRVTNPLYKVYDPRGYRKSEDELAVECIQMVCDDLNRWIKSLTNSKSNSQEISPEDANSTDAESCGKHEDNSIIGPAFLIQILRKELELPEEYSDI